MKKSIFWTSIVEAIVVTLIITIWLTWMYNLFMKSQTMARTTWNRVQAIQMAREWLEAVINMRDTNALIYWWDMKNCWNSTNYNNLCIGDSANTNSTDFANGGSYIVFQDTDSRWKLSQISWLVWGYIYTNPNYRTSFRVKKDALNMYTQSWGVDFLPIFTREIKFTYSWATVPASNNDTVIVDSIVQWMESSSTSPYKVNLKVELTNWKGIN